MTHPPAARGARPASATRHSPPSTSSELIQSDRSPSRSLSRSCCRRRASRDAWATAESITTCGSSSSARQARTTSCLTARTSTSGVQPRSGARRARQRCRHTGASCLRRLGFTGEVYGQTVDEAAGNRESYGQGVVTYKVNRRLRFGAEGYSSASEAKPSASASSAVSSIRGGTAIVRCEQNILSGFLFRPKHSIP